MDNNDNGSGFKKFDQGKLPLSRLAHIPVASLMEEADAFEFGAEKYGWENFRKGTRRTRYADAALRHVFEWLRGRDADPETGLSPLVHAIASLRIVRELELAGAGEDDRTPYGAPGEDDRTEAADDDWQTTYDIECLASVNGHCFACNEDGACCFCGDVKETK
jgi:hypothetical protein